MIMIENLRKHWDIKNLWFNQIKFHIHLITMSDHKVSQEFRLEKIDETRNYFIEEIKQNDLITKKYKKV